MINIRLYYHFSINLIKVQILNKSVQNPEKRITGSKEYYLNFLQHWYYIKILQLFLKDHVAPKTGVKADENSALHYRNK